MLNKVAQNINRKRLLSHDAKHLVALSGGADSVALLCILHQLNYDVEAIHCNFRLRGEESERDEAFCKDLCQKHGIKLHLAHFDTKEYASLHHISIEMAARELRYRYFYQLRHDINAESICVAHHKDDQAETILLNIIRGTGIQGLTGMSEKRDFIVRPLLAITRREIKEYLDKIGQKHIEDSSNAIDDVKRNKLRLNIIPLLKEMNPKVVESLCEMAENVNGVIPMVEDSFSRQSKSIVVDLPTTNNNEGFCINIDALMSSLSPEYNLFKLLENKQFTSTTIKSIFNSINTQSGKHWETTNHIAYINDRHLYVEKKQAKPETFVFPEEGTYVIGDNKKIKIEIIDKTPDFIVEKSKEVATLDFHGVKFPLRLRPIENGDRFVPFGMNGSKLVSDYLTDRKIPLTARRQQLMLVDKDENTLWLVGERTDNRFRITSDTIKMIIVRYIN